MPPAQLEIASSWSAGGAITIVYIRISSHTGIRDEAHNPFPEGELQGEYLLQTSADGVPRTGTLSFEVHRQNFLELEPFLSSYHIAAAGDSITRRVCKVNAGTWQTLQAGLTQS